jgi:uncharacterized membrane protein YphA (DoxX/SURF4 family)
MKVVFEFDMRAALRWLLALLLIWAALGKLANLQEFHAALAAYRLPMPAVLLRFLATFLPWLELVCGILLVAGGERRAALLWAVVLAIGFVLATGQAWARGLRISCGCFNLDFLGDGVVKQFVESVPFAFARALVLLAIALGLFRSACRAERRPDHP